MYIYALVLFLLHFIRIFDQNFWADEAFTIVTIRESFSEMVQITANDVHPPLYYIIVKIFAEIFGYTGPVYHFATIVPYGLVLFLGVTFIRKWFGKETTFIFITFASLLTSSIQMNVEVRMYSWASFFVLVSFLALYKILTDETSYAWIIFTISGLAAAYTHYYCLISVAFFYIALILFVLLKERKYLKKMIMTCGITVICYLPWLFVLLETFQRSTDEFWQTEIQPIWHFFDAIFDTSLSMVFFIGFVVVLILWIRQEQKMSEQMIWMCAGIAGLVGTAVVGLTLSVMIRPMFISRYLYPISVVAWLLFGVCVSRMKKKTSYAIIVVILMLFCGIPDYVSTYIDEKKSDIKLEETLAMADSLIQEDDIIITNDMYIYWTVAELYYPENRCDYFDFEYPDLEVDKTYWCINTKKLNEKKIEVLEEKGLLTELVEDDGVLGTYKVRIYKMSPKSGVEDNGLKEVR